MATAIATLSERSPGCNGMSSRASAAACTSSGTPADSRPNSRMSRRLNAVVEIGRCRLGREKNQPQVLLPPPLLEIPEAFVPDDADLVEIIHPGAAEGAVGDRKAGGLDNMRLQPETGAESQNRSGILRDVGLEEGDPHGLGRRRRFPVRRPGTALQQGFAEPRLSYAIAGLRCGTKGANKTPPERAVLRFQDRPAGPLASLGDCPQLSRRFPAPAVSSPGRGEA